MLNMSYRQQRILWEHVRDYRGSFDEIEGALGALVAAHFYGWRVVQMVHSGRTMRAYERALGFSIKEVTHERTPLSHKSVGLRLADSIGSYWAYVRGERGDTKLRRVIDAGNEGQRELAL